MFIVISSQAPDAFLVGSGWSLLFSDGLLMDAVIS